MTADPTAVWRCSRLPSFTVELAACILFAFLGGVSSGCDGNSEGSSDTTRTADAAVPDGDVRTDGGAPDGEGTPDGNDGEDGEDPEKGPCEQLDDSDRRSTADPEPVESFPLDDHSGARAGYSLRKLRSNYDGPAVRVRRGSDDQEKDIGYTEDGWVDAAAIESFVDGSDGFVVKWYAQVEGTPDLVQEEPDSQPRIARGGTIERDSGGFYTISFDSGHSMAAEGFDSGISTNDYTFWGVVRFSSYSGETEVFGIGRVTMKPWNGAMFRGYQTYINGSSSRFGGDDVSLVLGQRNMITLRNDGNRADIWQGNTRHAEDSIEEDSSLNDSRTRSVVSVGGGFEGTLGEFAVYPDVSTQTIHELYASAARDWDVGPVEWNPDADLPQQFEYQVTLYDWLKGLSVEDVELPDGSLEWDADAVDSDRLADLWLQSDKLTASSVTRGEPEWYVLDAGNGKGIEATDGIRVWHEPKGSRGYGGNPPRSWANEPAYWYKLDLPLEGGEQGNPYHKNKAVARRALAVAMVDMLMHHKNWANGASGWYDMFGKAALSWAETYRWTGEVLPPDVREAFEAGMGHVLDRLIAIGPRAVNTNMDMFAVQAQADFAMATDDPKLECKAVRAARAALFGHVDGEMGSKHDVFAAGKRDGGVFDPAGFIMEGGQPDVFYGGESMYHLAGALAAVTDRDTGEMPPEWSFLEDVVQRMQAWRTYQYFYDPAAVSPGVGGKDERRVTTAGAGFSGRTSYGVPAGQAGENWKGIFIGSRFENHAFRAWVPDAGDMKDEIQSKLDNMNGELSETYEGEPPEWGGWSPWAKKTPYLPQKGWYSRLKSLDESDDPKFEKPPVARSGVEYNKKFGEDPIGDEYWAYKSTDGDQSWGFFLEAQARQGGYGGWYGGKIETFWTESTGVVLVNRHGKTGCDDGNEDSTCWDNMEKKAGHHVWGRDEKGNAFTTLLLRGRNLERTSEFDLDNSPPMVTVTNIFNDPSHSEDTRKSGERTGSEIEGDLEIENTFAARSEGLEVTHRVTSDETDEVRELWASLPVYLRHYNPKRAGDNLQKGLEDTSIEYRADGSWEAMPEDQDGDDTPELVSTDTLRLGRDYQMGDGMQYVYVVFDQTREVRLSEGTYYDPYQSKTGVRTVHVDLHGNPGSTESLPGEASVTYTLQPAAP